MTASPIGPRRGGLLAVAGAATVAAITLAGCPTPPASVLPAGLVAPFEGYSSVTYADDSRWLCRPDLPGDPCHRDLTALDVRADGTRVAVPHVPKAAPDVDCFYVYPTVDLRLRAANHDDFTDLAAITAATLAQAARFSEVCAVYVPLYRQVTIGTFFTPKETRERKLAVAFSDVADAFVHYMGRYNKGRKVVLIGHSQGALMIVRLLVRFFDGDPVMRERLLLAMPIGGSFAVPKGRTVGGTLANIPICTHAGERGCVIAYRTYRDGRHVRAPIRVAGGPGNELACVNPAAVGTDERRWFSRTIFPVSRRGGTLRGFDSTGPPFAIMRDFYAGRCFTSPDGYRYLAVEEAPASGDVRVGPVDFDATVLARSGDFHTLDMTFPQGDLVDLVARAIAGR